MAAEVIIDLSEVPADFDPDQEYDPTLDPELGEAVESIAPKPKPKPQLSDTALAYLRRHRLLSFNQLMNLPPIEWFVEDLIPEGLTMVQGQGGSYKSFLVLDWMLCAATNRAWHGRAIKPGSVLYMAGEGARGLPRRLDAWCHANHVDPATLHDSGRLTFIADPIQFGRLDQAEKDAWRSFITALDPGYLVVDTLHTSSSGVDENSNADMAMLLQAARYIVAGATDCQLIFIHHKGKGDGKVGGRGASSLRDDFDVTLDVEVAGDYVARLKPDKIRDAEAFKPLLLCFERYAHTDSDRSSLYIESVEQEAGPVGQHKTAKRTRIDDAMEAITDHGLLKEGWGEGRITDALKALDLGYNFSHNTVGKAIKRLRETEQALADMRRNADAD